MSLTVTAAQSGTGAFDGMALTVRVVTGQAASPIGATASSGTVTAPELPITPAATGSYVYGAVYNANVSTAFTAATGTTFSQNTSDTGDGVAYGTFRLTAYRNVLDNLITGSMENLAHLEGDPRLHFQRTNVSDGISVDGHVDFVFHFASPASPDDFKRFPIQVMKVGSVGTMNALGFAKAKKAKFMVASTSEVYGDPLISPQPETYWGNVNPIGPRSVYDEAKRFSEALTMAYRTQHGLDTRIVRFFNTYGPRMRLDDGRVVPNFVKQALLGEPLTVYGDGSQTRSFGYYEDTIDGVYRLASSDYHEPVNIGTEEERTVLEFAKDHREFHP